jgi:biotin-[acetyl-CoA-carboxylase] ligase BirA-like protein
VIVEEARSSQFDSLQESLAGGAELPGPTACVALRGRGFHGQRGRPWLSAPGNLHLCAVVPAPRLAAREAGALPMLPAVAVLDAIHELGGGTLRPGIKWINDVLVDGRKIAGVLTATQIQEERVEAVLLGIGLNVASAPPVPPTPFVPAVSCLTDAGVRTTWADAAVSLLAAIGRRTIELATDGAEDLLDAYRAASVVIGRDVCVFPDPGPEEPSAGPTPIACGSVRGVAADLSLIIEDVESPVASGRLAFAEDCHRGGR